MAVKDGSFPFVSVVTGQTTSATAGTRSTHAHGLKSHKSAASAQEALTPTWVQVVEKAADDNTNNGAAAVSVVSFDATNVVVKSTGTSVAFDLIAYYME